MSPLNITQPLGIWSIRVYNGYYFRWCPIYPKWDSYQPLFYFIAIRFQECGESTLMASGQFSSESIRSISIFGHNSGIASHTTIMVKGCGTGSKCRHRVRGTKKNPSGWRSIEVEPIGNEYLAISGNIRPSAQKTSILDDITNYHQHFDA